MTINYYIDANSRTKQDAKIIFAYIRGLGKGLTIKLHTGERLQPKHWDREKQRARRSYPECTELNSYLNKKSEEAQSMYRRLMTERNAVSPNSCNRKRIWRSRFTRSLEQMI